MSSAASELFGEVIAAPIERRRAEFMQSVADRLLALEAAQQIDRGKLSNDEAFVSTAYQAIHLAARNHQEEKREALRNAIINAALPDAPEASIQQTFLRLIDELTPTHLRLLKLAQDQKRYIVAAGKTPPEFSMTSSLWAVVIAAHPEWSDRRELVEQAAKDLLARGLTDVAGLFTMMSAGGAYAKRTKSFGDAFLAFISERQ